MVTQSHTPCRRAPFLSLLRERLVMRMVKKQRRIYDATTNVAVQMACGRFGQQVSKTFLVIGELLVRASAVLNE